MVGDSGGDASKTFAAKLQTGTIHSLHVMTAFSHVSKKSGMTKRLFLYNGDQLTLAAIAMGCLLLAGATDALGASGYVYETIDENGLPQFSTDKTVHSTQILRFDAESSSFPPVSVRSMYRHAPDADIRELLRSACQRYSVPLALALSVASVESDFNRSAMSPKGAIGVMQILPQVRPSHSDTLSSAENIDRGVHLLGDLLRTYRGNLALVAAAYNAGSATVTRYGSRIPPYPETMLYVSSVLNRMKDFSAKPQ